MRLLLLQRRFIACAIDSSLASTIWNFLPIALPDEIRLATYTLFGREWNLDFYPVSIFILAYFILFDVVNNGLTVGKRIMKLKTMFTKTTPANTSFNRAVRSFIKTFCVFVVPIVLPFYCFTRNTLHDLILKTQTRLLYA